ncbi:MAG: sigma 54-interacting transcriptional regulator [Myxococcota bacterium]
MPSEIRIEHPRLLILTGDLKGRAFELVRHRTRLGSDADNDVVLKELAPVHVELVQETVGIRLVDRSGGETEVNGTRVHEAIVGSGAHLALRGLELRLQDTQDALTVMPSDRERFGEALARSLSMREVFGVLEAVAPTTASILLLGETGSGKDILARGVHALSPRAEGPMQTLDCGAIAPTLVESELFGYERGAFTGAEDRQAGAFERAHGGTLFLDEIGELPLGVQPKLLRALEDQVIQRVGSSEPVPVNVRIVAATKRDLKEEVRRGRFREDLWFRLAVVTVTLPPLRERRDDIPLLVKAFAKGFEARTGVRADIPAEELSTLHAHDWPGNVRELKNTVERALWLAQTGDGVARFMVRPQLDFTETASPVTDVHFDPTLSFGEHKQGWEESFEKSYLGWLMARADGSLSKASRLASMDRKHLRNLLRKHGLYEPPEPEAG